MDNDQTQADFEVVDRPVPFKIFSGLLRAHRDDGGVMRLKGIASSSVQDRHGDRMTQSALEDMVRAAKDNMTIFLNHSYSVPEDVAGSVEDAQLVQRGTDGDSNPIWDLDFDVRVNAANPRAVDAFAAIEKGTKLGLSIGAMIPEGGAVRDKKKGTYVFNHVDLLETSIVGIPANPRSWVSTMVKALKSTTPTQALIETSVVNITPEALSEMSDNLDRKVLLAADNPKQAEPAEDAPPQPQEVPATPDDDPPQPQEVPEPDDEKKSVSEGSQGAPDSEPDDEPDSGVEASTQPDDVSLASALTETLHLYEAAASELVEKRRQLLDALEERDAARRERDEAQAMSREFMAKATFIIEKLADMPVGRKAVVRNAKDELSSLERIYGVETMKLIRSSNDGNGG